MHKSFIKITPSSFKAIVVIWTILGLSFSAAFLFAAFMIIQDLSQANLKFMFFPFSVIPSLLLSVLFPLVFVLYYYSRFTLSKRPATVLRWLFIASFPLLIYCWITIFPSLGTIDIVYEIVFLLLHTIVFLKYPGYFNVLRFKS
jgi:hypothetical protein